MKGEIIKFDENADYKRYGKNLIDVDKEINNIITMFSKQGEIITSVEMNQYTNDYIKSGSIYGFKDIHIIINNDLINNEIKVNREKMINAIEYMPYEVGELDER